MACFSIPIALSESIFGITYLYKNIQFFLLIYVFSKYEYVTGCSFEFLLRRFINYCLVFVIINLIAYFIYIPIFEKFRPWWGRISHGYPTMDVITLTYALFIYYFLFLKIEKKFFINLLKLLLLLIGIVMQFTGTGIVCLVLFFMFVFMSVVFKPNILRVEKSDKIFLTFVLSGLILGWWLNNYMQKNHPVIYKNGLTLIEMKIANLAGKKTEINTLDIRDKQFQKAKENYLNNDIKTVFGISTGFLSMTEREKYVYIENQYNANQMSYGIVGNSLYMFMLFYSAMTFLVVRKKDLKMLGIAINLILAINSYTLVPLYLFSNMAGYALLYSYIYKRHITTKNAD